MRPFKSTISLEEARRRLDAHVRPIARRERVALGAAVGRVAASDVRSDIDVPPFARSAMDGYAVVAADVAGASRTSPITLRVVERIYTGQPPQLALTPGTCAEIATGAPLPAGADAVVMVEETVPSADGATVQILTRASAGQNIGLRGADITAGDRIVAAGDLLTPSRVGALAAIGRGDAEVFAQPVVGILSTGNEVVDVSTGPRELAPGQIYDVNRYTLSAIVESHGGIARVSSPVADTVDALAAALDGFASADIMVFSGGSSVGERDLIVDAIARKGEMIFHGIAVKPGKPTAFALVGGVPFFGMPGNPTSCLSNAYILLVPFLRATARLPPWKPRTVSVPLGKRIQSQAGRHQFYTVRLENGAAMPAFKGSGDITSLSRADGYIEIPAAESVLEQGRTVDVTLF
jgi:molybdenum cofactor synthesis domain-containing protein